MARDLANRPPGRWTPSSAEGRWCGFGPYYAMFPVEFVRQTMPLFTEPGSSVLDPFCGRGTVPFVAQATGRVALGSDLNPVAWLYSAVKLDPHPHEAGLNRRVRELIDMVEVGDAEPANEFQKLAWERGTLAFLNSARKHLDWRSNRLDRTLMGFVLVHLHAKKGGGLSNQLRQSKAMAPDYSVRWWKDGGWEPPSIDIRSFFSQRFAWRYKKGLPSHTSKGEVRFGDAREVFKRDRKFKADFILTSPPYCGVTDYAYDNWIRNWMLGGSALPPTDKKFKFANRENYAALIADVFKAARRISNQCVSVYVRTDAREFTREATATALATVWPEHTLLCRFDKAAGPTQTALFGNAWKKAGELDLLLLPAGRATPDGFQPLRIKG